MILVIFLLIIFIISLYRLKYEGFESNCKDIDSKPTIPNSPLNDHLDSLNEDYFVSEKQYNLDYNKHSSLFPVNIDNNSMYSLNTEYLSKNLPAPIPLDFTITNQFEN
tara:strand:- start:167 stop:490 length:324 start_codon:yes stop_codon:yes gene_type:complete